MPKLTKPGISDLHWQVTAMAPADVAVSFWETEDDAKHHAMTLLEASRTSVYVAQVMHQGEHLRKAVREPLTVETVTCKEIREEQHRASLAGDRDWMRTCNRALTLGGSAERQAVAAAINARREGSK